MIQYTAIDGQSLLDVCLNTYGSFDSLIELILDNNNLVTVNDNVNSGENFVFYPAPDTPIREPIYSTAMQVSGSNNQTFYIIDAIGERLTNDDNSIEIIF